MCGKRSVVIYKDVLGLASLSVAEFYPDGSGKKTDFGIEEQDGVSWKVFYVVAPDGLCFWFGEPTSGGNP